jgi:hypothetical protein
VNASTGLILEACPVLRDFNVLIRDEVMLVGAETVRIACA